MDSFKRFNEEKLLDRGCFDTSAKGKTTGGNGKILDIHISDEGYLTCIKIWNEFNMKNMADYHDHYLKKDVLLLADVFEKFIDTCLTFYKLDPSYHFSSPWLSWDVMLKMSGVKLEKISNIHINLIPEKGLRGGISYIAKKYSGASNKYMKNHDTRKPPNSLNILTKIICMVGQ